MRSLIPAVGYLSRSTHKQEKSIADQKREIERYAAEHGYQISVGTPTMESAATKPKSGRRSKRCTRRRATAGIST